METAVITLHRYECFDPDGKVAEWIATGRGVHVWRCADLGSPRIGQLTFTPGDRPDSPHWSNRLAERIDSADRLAFYRRWRIRWISNSDGPAGRKAAEARTPEDCTRPGPHGKTVKTAYTIERIVLVPFDERTFWQGVRGLGLRATFEAPNRPDPLDCEIKCSGVSSRWAVIEWACILGDDDMRANPEGGPNA